MIKRVFLIVLDSFGVGELEDAGEYGDKGANTLRTISKSPFYKDANLRSLGLSDIPGVDFLEKGKDPVGAYGRMVEKSRGKDTTTGHWEIAGLISEEPFPTYPNGFPDEIIKEFSEKCGRGVVCNKPYSGTEVIKDYGAHHVKTGDLIVYTSADSVFQIAAHEKVVPVETLYEYCRIARNILRGKHAVARVIARPFVGDEDSGFTRTANRHDFSLEPPGETVLDVLKAGGLDVIAVGKITDIFVGRGITESIFTHSNTEGMAAAENLLSRDFHGLCFVNLVDFDMLYGHRNDIDGYAKATAEFDGWLSGFKDGMREDDVLIITADHGCDPGDVSTDHTREHVPLLVYGNKISPAALGTRNTFADIAATVSELLGVTFSSPGDSFAQDIYKGE